MIFVCGNLILDWSRLEWGIKECRIGQRIAGIIYTSDLKLPPSSKVTSPSFVQSILLFSAFKICSVPAPKYYWSGTRTLQWQSLEVIFQNIGFLVHLLTRYEWWNHSTFTRIRHAILYCTVSTRQEAEPRTAVVVNAPPKSDYWNLHLV